MGLKIRSSWVMLVLLGATSCALTNKADPLNLRYFAPFRPEALQEAAPRAPGQEPISVRIDRVEAAAHLTESMAYRESESELGYYEELRWTEIPSVYLERAVDEALFTDGTLRRGLTEGAYTLSLTLEAFEELTFAQSRARVVTRVWVGNERVVLSERRFVFEEPIGDDEGAHREALMAAFTRALQRTAEAVRRELDAVVALPPPSLPTEAPLNDVSDSTEPQEPAL